MRLSRPLRLGMVAMLLLACLAGCGTAPNVVISSLSASRAPGARVASGALDDRFEVRRGSAISLMAPADTWWRVTSKTTLGASRSPRLELSDVYLAQVEAWRRGSAAPARYSTFGPDAEQRYSTRGLAIPLAGGITAGDSVYLKIEAYGVAPLRVDVESLAQARLRDLRHTEIRSMLLTSMMITCVLALGFGLGLGETSYFYFAAMVLCQVAYMVLIGGELRYSFAGAAALAHNLQAVRVAGLLGTVSSIEFMRMYLDLARCQPAFHRVLLACSAALGLDALASMATPAPWTGDFGNGLLLASLGVLSAATIRACIARQHGAWLVLVAWLPAIATAMGRAAEAMGWIAGPAWLGYAFPASFAFACVLLTLALTERMLAIRRERHEALLESERRTLQLATTGHDIRQPLFALRSAISKLASQRAVEPAVIEHFDRSIQYLDKLAAQYTAAPSALDFKVRPDTAAGAGRGDDDATGGVAAAEALSVDLLLRNVELMFRDEAEVKGLALRVRGSTAAVSADAMAAMRIVSNLVANAVKYTDKGKVLIGCKRRGGRIAIIVADTGPGMTDSELQRVTLAWERGASAAAVAGSGLGLSIATRLAAERGYGFRVRSTPGRGTICSVELPRI